MIFNISSSVRKHFLLHINFSNFFFQIMPMIALQSTVTPVFHDNCTLASSKCRFDIPNLHSASIYQVSKLSHSSYYTLSDKDNNTIIMNICRPLPPGLCQNPNGVPIGSCIVRLNSEHLYNRSTPVGAFSQDVVFENGKFRILYKPVEGSNISTEVIFLCNKFGIGNGQFLMKYSEESHTFKVFWYTHLVCSAQEKGLFSQGNIREIDLSSLTKPAGYYRIKNAKSDALFINPFQPFFVEDLPVCEEDAIACLEIWNIPSNGTRSASNFKITLGEKRYESIPFIQMSL